MNKSLQVSYCMPSISCSRVYAPNILMKKFQSFSASVAIKVLINMLSLNALLKQNASTCMIAEGYLLTSYRTSVIGWFILRLHRNRQLIFLRSASRRLQISRWKVRNILRLRLLKKAYKSRVRMLLTERQRQARIAAARHLLTHKAILPKTWFTDESWFYSDGIAQKKYQTFWALSKEAIEPISSQLEHLKGSNFYLMLNLIGPYFFSFNWQQHHSRSI